MFFKKKTDISYRLASLTDVGRVRQNNEDSVYALNENQPLNDDISSYGIYIIADGMGGHQAGEVASKMATNTIPPAIIDELKQTHSSAPSDIIEKAIKKANDEIVELAGSKSELNSMGTTVTLGLRLGNCFYLGHVGDSRAYLLRKGKLHQITEDHSLVARLIKEKLITAQEAKTHPDRGKILRCLGTSGTVNVDGYNQDGKDHKLVFREGDGLLICSDGLTGYASDRDILECLKQNPDPESACKSLIDLANSGGGGDNVSVIVVRTTDNP